VNAHENILLNEGCSMSFGVNTFIFGCLLSLFFTHN